MEGIPLYALNALAAVTNWNTAVNCRYPGRVGWSTNFSMLGAWTKPAVRAGPAAEHQANVRQQ
jgi:hypothetical protein